MTPAYSEGYPYHNGIPHRGIPLPSRQPPEGVSPFHDVNLQKRTPLSFHVVSPKRWYVPNMTSAHKGGIFLLGRHPIEEGITLWVTIFSLQCLSYVFDDGYAPGNQWSVLMMEFHHEFLLSSFDDEITVP